MRRTFPHSFKASLMLLTLSACAGGGGGGGGGTTTFPPPTPTPTPTPPPPAPINFDTQEYQDQPGLARINALPAYEAGFSGNGVIVAIVDSGIDLNNPEFNGRIHPQSADLVISGVVPPGDVRATPTLQDSDDHGTPVASIIGAGRNNRGVHGVAPEVTLLIFRGDDDSTTDPIIFGEAIAEGAQRAADNGAGVLNFSLGSDDAASRGEFAAVFSFTASNDIVTVVAAGNDGNADPQASALGAVDATGGATIIAGALNPDNSIASFTNRAGSAADFYLSAPGVLIPTTGAGLASGQVQNFSGTSAATPHIAGAAALVRQRWPSLTAKEIVDILFDTATDLGAAGTDPIFGRGLVNVGAAIQPVGTVTTASVDGVSTEIGAVGAQLSSSFGAEFAALGDIVVFDKYHRDFRTSLGQLVKQAVPDRYNLEAVFNPFDQHDYAVQRLSPTLSARMRLTSRDRSRANLANNLAASFHGERVRNDFSEETLALSLTGALGGGKSVTVAQGFSARTMDRMTATSGGAPFLSRNAFVDGYLPDTQHALTGIVRTPLTSKVSADFLFAYGYGEDRQETLFDITAPAFDGVSQAPFDKAVLRAGINFDLARGQLRVEQGIRHEDGTILDAQFGENSMASTYYTAVEAYWRLLPKWRVKARVAAGYTKAKTDGFGAFVDEFSGLTTTQFSMALAGDNLISNGDSFWVGVSQPMQLTSGEARLNLPTAFDKQTETLSFSSVTAPLGVSGQRLDYEASYRFKTKKLGAFRLNLLHQTFSNDDVRPQMTLLIRNGFTF